MICDCACGKMARAELGEQIERLQKALIMIASRGCSCEDHEDYELTCEENGCIDKCDAHIAQDAVVRTDG